MAKFRHLVPALGLMALIPAAMAEDAAKAPAVTFSGWADTVFSVSDTANKADIGSPTIIAADAPGTAKDEGGYTARFTGEASIKAAWKVGDKVTGKVNMWVSPADGNTTTTSGNTSTWGNSVVSVREAYFTYQVTDTIGIQGGKYIDHIGWISAEPTGLYLVNGSIIGYTGNTYGNDVLGAAVIITPKDSPIVGQIHVTNGYYTGADAGNGSYSSTPSTNRNNHDMGWGWDLTYTVNDKVSLNLEGAYDTHSGSEGLNSAGANDLGGNVTYVGLNATIKPTSDVLIGAEIQAKRIGAGQDDTGKEVGFAGSIYQGMVLANYILPSTPFPMSVTLSDQYIDAIQYGDDATVNGKTRQNGLQAALLTNPTGSTNFGVNLEVGYWQAFGEDSRSFDTNNGTTSEVHGWETALEGLVTF
jgi:hypothetical protein